MKFVRTEEGEILVRPIDSVKHLRGVLEGKTDKRGRTAVERLHEERTRDEADDAELRRRFASDDEAEG